MKNLGHVCVAPWRGLHKRERGTGETTLSHRVSALGSNATRQFPTILLELQLCAKITFNLFFFLDVRDYCSFWNSQNENHFSSLMIPTGRLFPIFLNKFARPAVGQVSPSWYLREILRTGFSAKDTQLRAARRTIARWGVVQLVGHLTVNEDGEGSNPSAPANFSARPGRLR